MFIYIKMPLLLHTHSPIGRQTGGSHTNTKMRFI